MAIVAISDVSISRMIIFLVILRRYLKFLDELGYVPASALTREESSRIPLADYAREMMHVHVIAKENTFGDR